MTWKREHRVAPGDRPSSRAGGGVSFTRARIRESLDLHHYILFRETFSDEAQSAAQLRAILPRDVVAQLDWSSLHLESGSFVSLGDDPRHCDLLFSVARVDGGGQVLVFVLFEHQSSNDRLIALRVLGYMVRIWDTWVRKADTPTLPLPPILPVVLSHDERGWRSATRFRDLFSLDAETWRALGPFVPDYRLTVDDLARATDEDLAARGLPATATLTLWALRDGRSGHRVLEHAVVWAPLFEALARDPGAQAVVDRLMRYLGVAGGKRSVSLEALAKKLIEHGPTTQQVIMNSVEKLIEKGRKQGMEMGRQEGRQEGQREALLRQLRLKFGDLRDEHLARVASAHESELEQYLERILTADSLAAVFGG